MEKNKIYIPINIQTETMIFQGYGMSELFKTLAFTAITSVIWIILFIIKHSSIQLAFENHVFNGCRSIYLCKRYY